MSKLNQIQSELKRINDAKFQELCDSYLHRLGYDNIKPIGSAIGNEKTVKGTPDSLIMLPNGKYVFVEYTTQQTGLFLKLSNDLTKCFDKEKTDIPISKIEEIILCHNSTLKPQEEEKLAVLCQERGCALEIISIETLAFDLYQKFPVLAKDFLGIEVDSGQILCPIDFIKDYQKSAFATPLDIKLRFRDDELKTVDEALTNNDLVIITGKAGVGKSRLGLECCKRFAQKYGYQSYCIHNKGIAIYEDLKAYFSPDGYYVILVDDANRITQLGRILSLINDQTTNRKIKIIVTVRDYALNKVKEAAKESGKYVELFLNTIEDKQIQEIISSEYGIHNQLYIERICDIAKGNPRLAIMASRIASAERDLESIADVSTVYDEYFGSIVTDSGELNDTNLMKVAGIVSFFGSLDRTNQEHFSNIAAKFSISEELFWWNVKKLHSLEIVDLYEDDVVKITDQVLSTYLFYKAFIKDQILDFSILLDVFFYEHRLRDTVYPVISAFNKQFVMTRLQSHIDRKWESAKKDPQCLVPFMEVFWFLKQTDILCYYKELIDSIPDKEYVFSDFNFNLVNSSGRIDFHLEILRLFGNSEKENFEIALELIFSYLEKVPSVLPDILHLFTEDFSFDSHSYIYHYIIQNTLILKLIMKSQTDKKSDLYTRILLRITGHYLKMQFMRHSMKSRNTMVMREFCVAPHPNINQLRSSLWKFLTSTYSIDEHKETVLQVIIDYSAQRREEVVASIVEEDSKLLLPFIITSLNPDNYVHCVVVQSYLRLLRDHNIIYDEITERMFVNETYNLARVLLHDYTERADMGWEEYHDYKAELLRTEFLHYGLSDYVKFIGSCVEICKHISGGHNEYLFRSAVHQVFLNIAAKNTELFREVVVYTLSSGNILKIQDSQILSKLLSAFKTEHELYNLLKTHEYHSKTIWLFNFLGMLNSCQVNKFYLNELYDLYKNSALEDLPGHLDLLNVYENLDKDVYVKVTKIVLDRIERTNTKYFFYAPFTRYCQTFDRLEEIYAGSIEILKKSYFNLCESQSDQDYDGAIFEKILNCDPKFIFEYIDWLFERYQGYYYNEDRRNYSFLWRLDNYNELITIIARYIFCKRSQFGASDYLISFFIKHSDAPDDEVEFRKEKFIGEQIVQYHQDTEYMRFIFGMVAYCMGDKRMTFIKTYVQYNRNYDAFQELPIDSNRMMWSGSAVPIYEKKINFLASLLPIFSTVDLLQHKLYIERNIQLLKREIERETKREFMEVD